MPSPTKAFLRVLPRFSALPFSSLEIESYVGNSSFCSKAAYFTECRQSGSCLHPLYNPYKFAGGLRSGWQLTWKLLRQRFMGTAQDINGCSIWRVLPICTNLTKIRTCGRLLFSFSHHVEPCILTLVRFLKCPPLSFLVSTIFITKREKNR